MKTAFTFLFACALITHADTQTTHSVSNHPLGGAQFSHLWSAYEAADVDDILLVEGTPTPHQSGNPNIVWNKRLIAIGQGINTQKQGFETTKFWYAGYAGSFTIAANAAGSRFYGIDFMPDFVNLSHVNNIVFEDCIFRGDVNGSYNGSGSDNIVFKNCIFQGNIVLASAGCMNWLITNCVIDGQIVGANAQQSIIVDHCLFLSPIECFSGVDQAEVKNSMFMNVLSLTGITNSNFQNNLAVIDADGDGDIDGDGDTESYFRFPETGNNIDAGGNLIADPMMVNYTLGSLYSPEHDYHLQEGSPGVVWDADGDPEVILEIGVHGGFTHFSERGEPLVTPVIRSMNVINTSVAPGGTLSVHVVASKPFSN